MEYHANGWLGRWQNFEAYLTSSDPYLTRAWQDAETAAAAMPMFCGGVKAFWQRACVTTSSENPHTLGGWNIIMASGEKLCIEWLDEDGASLGKAVYHLESVLEKGLEGKENALFVAEDMPENWPFRCLLAMEPMPPRTARQIGGLLSHLHFQYASQRTCLWTRRPRNCTIPCGMPPSAMEMVLCWKSATLCVRCTICRCGMHCRNSKPTVCMAQCCYSRWRM